MPPRPPPRDVLVVGNNWDGTADVVDPHALKVVTRLNIVPDLARAPRGDRRRPARARVLHRRQPAHRRGPQPVRRRRVHLARRALPLRLAAQPRRRRRLRPRHAPDRLAGEGRRLPLRPHGDLARRPAAARLGLDRGQGPGHRHAARRDRRRVRLRRPAAREQLLRRRDADLPREHRQRLHPAGRQRAGRAEGQARLSDRRRADVRDPQAHRRRRGARGQRLPGPELRRAADGAVARRALRLPAALLPARLRRVRPRSPASRRGSPTCRSPPRPRRCRARATCSTPPTTASR